MHLTTKLRVMGQSIPKVNSENQIVGYVGTVTITECRGRRSIFQKELLRSDNHNDSGSFHLGRLGRARGIKGGTKRHF
jgi:hypothetical protein